MFTGPCPKSTDFHYVCHIFLIENNYWNTMGFEF